MFSLMTRSQEKDTISATKFIIETHIAAKRYYNYSRGIIRKTATRVHYIKEKMLKLIVALVKCKKAGSH